MEKQTAHCKCTPSAEPAEAYQSIAAHHASITPKTLDKKVKFIERTQSAPNESSFAEGTDDNRIFTDEKTHGERILVQTYRRASTGRFEILIPFKENVDQLGNNYRFASCYFHVNEKRPQKIEIFSPNTMTFETKSTFLRYIESAPSAHTIATRTANHSKLFKLRSLIQKPYKLQDYRNDKRHSTDKRLKPKSTKER